MNSKAFNRMQLDREESFCLGLFLGGGDVERGCYCWFWCILKWNLTVYLNLVWW